MLAVEQGVFALDVVVGRELGGEARQHAALGFGLEGAVTPPAHDQVVGLLLAPQLLVGRGQCHGPLGGSRLGAAEPGDDARGVEARGLDGLFRGDLPTLAPWPAGEVAPGLVQLEKGQLLAIGVDHRPEHDLARHRIGEAGHGRLVGGGVAAPGGGQTIRQAFAIGVAQPSLADDGRELDRRRS